MKFFNHWFRKIHRWLTIPFIIIVISVAVTRGEPINMVLQRIQQIFMLTLITTGSYLYLLPYIVKRNRNQRKKRPS